MSWPKLKVGDLVLVNTYYPILDPSGGWTNIQNVLAMITAVRPTVIRDGWFYEVQMLDKHFIKHILVFEYEVTPVKKRMNNPVSSSV